MNLLTCPVLRITSFTVALATLTTTAVAQPEAPAPTVPPPCAPVAGPKVAGPDRSAALPGFPDRVAPPKEPHHYLYFPAREIYYAPETLQWFWQGGGHWNYGSNLPLGYGPQTGIAGVSITLMTDRPYQEHADVVQRYGGKNAAR